MNILIIEDEYKTAILLKEMIESNQDCRVVYISQSIQETVSFLTKNQDKIELIFMDIELADGKSFEIFKQIEVIKPVIFCTAFSEFTLQAFKNNGIDYILKPFKKSDVDFSLKKVVTIKNSFTKLEQISTPQKSIITFQKSFIGRFREKIIPILIQEIAIIFLKNGVIHVKTFNEEQSIIFKTLEEIESIIDPNDFFRINRQMIVNRNAIKNITPLLNRKLEIKISVSINEKMIVSRLKVSTFKIWLESR